MSNSSLVSYTNLSSKHSGLRTDKVDRITPHCVVGQWSAKKIADYFKTIDRDASCNYGIGKDGDVCLVVEEKNRSWCSSSNANDQRAITIECASDTKAPYKMNDKVYNTLVDLCIDICKRYGKKKLLWIEDKNTSLSYKPKDDEMVLTVHRWFSNKSCPGDWLYSKLSDLASKVTASLNEEDKLYRVRKEWANATSQIGTYRILDNAKKAADNNYGYKVFDENGEVVYEPKTESSFHVKVSIPNLNVRTGPGTNYPVTGFYTNIGVFTIVEVKKGKGSSSGWGRLKSGVGWISLDYCKKI